MVMSSPTAARSVVLTTCTAVSGSPAARSPACTQAAIAWVERIASRPPPQNPRVAGFQAQPGGARRDVGARLVDDADHAERHAHPADLDAGRAVAHLADLADRVGQLSDLP